MGKAHNATRESRLRSGVRRDAGCGGLPTAPASLLTATGATPREAWVAWLAPRFATNDSAYFTGTYSDEYGFDHGLMLQRNVHKDFIRFLRDLNLLNREWVCGVEKHAFRDILHLHAIVGGPFDDTQLKMLKAAWGMERGFAKSLPVQDRCASYVTKYALKGDTDAFEWSLT